MPSSHSPHPKSASPNVLDVENGDRIELDSKGSSRGESSFINTTIPPHASSMTNSEGETARAHQHPWYESARWKDVERKLPTPLTRCTRAVWNWLNGPQPSRRHRIKPFFEPVQTFHTRLLARLPRVFRICIFVAAFMLWIVVFGVVLKNHSLPSDIAGFGAPVKLSCTNKLWYVLSLHSSPLQSSKKRTGDVEAQWRTEPD